MAEASKKNQQLDLLLADIGLTSVKEGDHYFLVNLDHTWSKVYFFETVQTVSKNVSWLKFYHQKNHDFVPDVHV